MTPVPARKDRRVTPIRVALACTLSVGAIAAGCTSDDGTSVVIANRQGGTSGGVSGSVSSGATPAPGATATPTPVPTATATATPPPSNLSSRIDTSSTPAPVATNPPVSTATPAPIPLGQIVGFPVSLGANVTGMALFSNSTAPWFSTSAGLIQVYLGQRKPPIMTYLAGATALAADPDNSDLWIASPSRLDRASLSPQSATLGVPASGFASASLTVAPVGLAVDGTEVWVANSDGSIAKLVKSTGTLTTLTPTGVTTPRGIALDPTNAWIVGGTNTLYQVNRATLAVTPFTVGNQPVPLAIDGNGALWTANQSGNSLSKVSGGAVSNFNVGGSPVAIATRNGRIWAALANNQIAWLNLDGSAPGTASLPLTPAGLAVDATGQVWVYGSTPGIVVTLQGH